MQRPSITRMGTYLRLRFTEIFEMLACLDAAKVAPVDPGPCDDQVVCVIACDNGMKQDDNGCYLCECLP